MADTVALNEDEKRLAELGYKQELNRSWSGFSNFAISFSIISILAGCFTSFGLGWNNGGPAAIIMNDTRRKNRIAIRQPAMKPAAL